MCVSIHSSALRKIEKCNDNFCCKIFSVYIILYPITSRAIIIYNIIYIIRNYSFIISSRNALVPPPPRLSYPPRVNVDRL